MQQIKLVLIGFTMLVFTSCKKSSNNILLSNSDYIVFGHFYGFCIGEACIEIFKLEQSQLLEDIIDASPNYKDFYNGNFIQLSQPKFDNTKDIVDFFPTELLDETTTIIGQPDAGDWGGIYVEYNFKGVRKFWLLDQMKSNVPAKYHNFIDKINEKIKQLQ